jgi:hypothetical protein
VIGVFFVHGFIFASWTAHIPRAQQSLGLSNGRLGLALLGAPIGSVLAMVMAGRLLPKVGSPLLVRVALVGYCVSGPLVGLTGSLDTFFIAFLLWGFFQGMLDVSMNTQAITVERFSGRVLMPGFHGSWSAGALFGAVTGAMGSPPRCFPMDEWRARLNPRSQSRIGAAVLYRVRSSCSAQSSSPTCCAKELRLIGRLCTSTTRCTLWLCWRDRLLRPLPSPCWSSDSPATGSSPDSLLITCSLCWLRSPRSDLPSDSSSTTR